MSSPWWGRERGQGRCKGTPLPNRTQCFSSQTLHVIGVPRGYGCPQCGLAEAVCGIDKVMSFVVSGLASHYVGWTRLGHSPGYGLSKSNVTQMLVM